MVLVIFKLLIILLIAVVLLTSAYALFAPMKFFVHTDKDELGIRWGAFIESRLIWDENISAAILEFRVPFYKKRIDILSLLNSPLSIKNKEKKETPKPKANRKITIRPSRILAILQSFKVREFKWNLDTDDFCLNAQLFPIFFMASLQGHQVSINFCGKNSLDLVVQNRLSNIIAHFIKPINHKTWMQHFIRIF